jgi:hypothetical protein
MQLLQDVFVIENLQVLSEGKNSGPTKIRGIFGRCNEKNNNGRIYPTSVLENQLAKVQPLINERRLCGELDHPQNDTVKLSNASHLITKLEMKGNELIGEAEILQTPAGLTAKALVDGGVKVGISSRGMGTLSEDHNGNKIVNEDFKLVTFDLVADPSTRGAYPALAESTESRFVQDSMTKLGKESNFITLLNSKLREAYQPWIDEAKSEGEHADDVERTAKRKQATNDDDSGMTPTAQATNARSLRRTRLIQQAGRKQRKALKAHTEYQGLGYALAEAMGLIDERKAYRGYVPDYTPTSNPGSKPVDKVSRSKKPGEISTMDFRRRQQGTVDYSDDPDRGVNSQNAVSPRARPNRHDKKRLNQHTEYQGLGYALAETDVADPAENLSNNNGDNGGGNYKTLKQREKTANAERRADKEKMRASGRSGNVRAALSKAGGKLVKGTVGRLASKVKHGSDLAGVRRKGELERAKHTDSGRTRAHQSEVDSQVERAKKASRLAGSKPVDASTQRGAAAITNHTIYQGLGRVLAETLRSDMNNLIKATPAQLNKAKKDAEMTRRTGRTPAPHTETAGSAPERGPMKGSRQQGRTESRKASQNEKAKRAENKEEKQRGINKERRRGR